jgi:hypothetical protein
MTTQQTPAFLFETAAIGHAASAVDGSTTVDRVLAILTANLTPLEQSIWRALLDDISIGTLARTHRVSRAELRLRITDMASKNPWVARWWQALEHLQLT